MFLQCDLEVLVLFDTLQNNWWKLGRSRSPRPESWLPFLYTVTSRGGGSAP